MTFIGQTQIRVLVIAAGPRTPTLDEVGGVVSSSLRKVNKLGVVLDGARLGDASEASNEELVRRAASQPVDRVMVVRVTGIGREATVYADTYELTGERYAGFALAAGAVLAPHVDPQASADAQAKIFDPALARAESEALLAASNDVSNAEREYFDKSLHFPRDVVLLGIYRDPMIDLDALEYMGLDATLELSKKRRRGRRALGVVGITVGLPMAGVGIFFMAYSAQDAANRSWLYGGLAAFGAGVGIGVGVIAGLSLRDPLDSLDMNLEVERYNQRLRRQLGLPANVRELVDERSFARRREGRQGPRLTLAPGFGQLVLSGRF